MDRGADEGTHVENFRICIWRARGPASGPATPAWTMEGEKYVDASRNRRRYACGSRLKLFGSDDTTSKSASTTAVSGVGDGSDSTKDWIMEARVDESTPCRKASRRVASRWVIFKL
jgi:hypothetical protein